MKQWPCEHILLVRDRGEARGFWRFAEDMEFVPRDVYFCAFCGARRPVLPELPLKSPSLSHEPLRGTFFCFAWMREGERFFVENTLADSRDGCWAKILRSWSGERLGPQEAKAAVKSLGGRVLKVRVSEVFEFKRRAVEGSWCAA